MVLRAITPRDRAESGARLGNPRRASLQILRCLGACVSVVDQCGHRGPVWVGAPHVAQGSVASALPGCPGPHLTNTEWGPVTHFRDSRRLWIPVLGSRMGPRWLGYLAVRVRSFPS